MRSLADTRGLLRAGADKIAINTAAINTPSLITDMANLFGSQCVVLSIEAKRTASGWECLTDNGRQHTRRDVLEWVREGERRGAGEVLLTSVDKEGTCRGYDLDLLRAVTEAVNVPVIASGGAGSVGDVVAGFEAGASACAVAHIVHYDKTTFGALRAAIEPGAQDGA